MKEKYYHFEGGPVSFFKFDERHPNIHLCLPKDPILGWTLTNTDEICHSLELSLYYIPLLAHQYPQIKHEENVRDMFIIQLEVKCNWTGTKGESLDKLTHKLLLASGSDRLKLKIYSPDRCTGKGVFVVCLCITLC